MNNYNKKTNNICPYCKTRNLYCNTNQILTSLPPKYSCHCSACDKITYIETTAVLFEEE